jgi:hypothetical protein
MNTDQTGAGGTWDVHVVADSDTRWKWGTSVAQRLRADGDCRTHGHLLTGRATPNDQQLADVRADARSVRRTSLPQLLHELAHTEAQVVVLACVGGTNQALLHGLARAWEGRSSRPVVLTGYVGLVYESAVDGLMLRAGADLVLANSARDGRTFRSVFEALGADPDSVVTTALPFLTDAPHDPTAAGCTRRFTVTVVAQPSVPEGRTERRYFVEQAVEHARRHPERQVVLKLRGRPGEQTTHLERYHYADLLRRLGSAPANLEVAYGPMSDVLDRTDLCVTVSSTAALEAMHRAIPTAVLTDFGIRESLGNHAFLESGTYSSWRELHDGAVPKTDPAWSADNGLHDPAPYDAVRARTAELVSDRSGLAPLHPWLQADRAGGYLPALLARNGLAVDGTPLPGWDGSDTGLARRALRRGARSLYDVSLSRVEPAVRRWAQL